MEELYFSVKDSLNGQDINLNNVSLPIIIEFTNFVQKFLKSKDNNNLKDVGVMIKNGSFAISVPVNDATVSVANEFSQYEKTGDIKSFSPSRLAVIREMQNVSKRNPNRKFTLLNSRPSVAQPISIEIDNNTEYNFDSPDLWVKTDYYMFGKVFDMGGKTKPNIHVQLEDGATAVLSATEEVLAGENENKMYKKQLLRVEAEQNIDTFEKRDEKLISFERYNPHFSEDEYDKVAEIVHNDWKDVPDVVVWIEQKRGNYVKE